MWVILWKGDSESNNSAKYSFPHRRQSLKRFASTLNEPGFVVKRALFCPKVLVVYVNPASELGQGLVYYFNIGQIIHQKNSLTVHKPQLP